jgi:CheY-like chemotaxis protein
MPRKDGFEACKDMRDIEKQDPTRPASQIIAVTALSADEEKKHGQQYVHFWSVSDDVRNCGQA